MLESNILFQISHFIFPHICMHCGSSIGKKDRFLCFVCNQLIQIEPSIISINDKYLDKVVVMFDSHDSRKSLMEKYCSYTHPYLAKSLSAYMAIAIVRSNLPYPNYLVPIRQKGISSFLADYNKAFYLAKSLSHFLKIPYLSRSFKLYMKCFSIKLENACILLLDDSMENEERFFAMAKKLKQKGAKKVYAITLH